MSTKKDKSPYKNAVAVAMNKRYPVGRSFTIENKERGGNKNEQIEFIQEYEDECEDDF